MKYRLSSNKKENNSNMIFTASNFDAISSSSGSIEDTVRDIAGEMINEAKTELQANIDSLDDKLFDEGSDVLKESIIPDMFDDIVVVDELPETGKTGVIYSVNGVSYYWDGSEFVRTFTAVPDSEIDEITSTVSADQIDEIFKE